MLRSGANKAREEFQNKDFWGPPRPLPTVDRRRYQLCACVFRGKRRPATLVQASMLVKRLPWCRIRECRFLAPARWPFIGILQGGQGHGPPKALYVGPFFPVFEGKRCPKHKELAGPGVPWRGGVWEGGVSGEILSQRAQRLKNFNLE